ncbi:MAG: D-alanyl-D-alanine carboxypeptidase [Candidatus Liptonbacteria bacterium]|nr:D-alanyl-D-alanine carboxypeptidase [Candidatus Liptonbacteria bacterium]
MSRNVQTLIFLVALAGAVVLGGHYSRGDFPAEKKAQRGAFAVVARPIAGTEPIEGEPGAALSEARSGLASLGSVFRAVGRAFYPRKAGLPPALEASSYVVADLATEELYASRASGARWPIASITKLMTAVIAADRIQSEAPIALTASDFSPESSASGLLIGDEYRARDLLKLALVASRNEAALALARQYGREAFVSEMNARAKEWGMSDTSFQEPTGLSAANQSTARDLVTLARKIFEEYPALFSVTRNPTVVVTELHTNTLRSISNSNAFSGELRFLGGKTGYTDEATGNLLTVFSWRGRPFVVAALGTLDRFGDTEKLFDWFTEHYWVEPSAVSRSSP